MPYEQLSKLYYKNKEAYNKVCEDRKNSVSSYKLPLFIGVNQSFYVVTNEMVNLICDINSNINKIDFVSAQVSPVAMNFFELNCLIEETDFTNNYEGVRSSRHELFKDILMKSTGYKIAKVSALINSLLKKGLPIHMEKVKRKNTYSLDLDEFEEICTK